MTNVLLYFPLVSIFFFFSYFFPSFLHNNYPSKTKFQPLYSYYGDGTAFTVLVDCIHDVIEAYSYH